MATLLGIPIALFLLLVADVFAHRLFMASPGWSWGILAVALAFAFSAAIGRAFDFLNFSALRGAYATRLARTFQGASNEERVYSTGDNDSHDISLDHPKDDLPHHEYHPEEQGGPLHFINVCVNETIDLASNREVRERKGLSMCATPHGVAVGLRYFALWAPPDERPAWQKCRRRIEGVDADDDLPVTKRNLTALAALPAASDPNAFHVLGTKASDTAEVESLSLGTWIAVSGAAFTTGVGRGTKLGLSLFMGLTNVRLGYWWDSGIRSDERPGRYPLPLWRKIKRFPTRLFRMQSMLLSEWRGRFHGASRWFWYLSDGGHFEVTGLYELLRRHVPFMIATDAGEDPDYLFEDVAQLTRQARMDFGAQIEWLDAPAAANVPAWIEEWLNLAALGPIRDLKREGHHHAALARVRYEGTEDISWILLLKPSLSDALTQDIRNYGAQHASFPQDSTFDQVFDDNQWESYRALGQQIALRVLRDPAHRL